MFSLILALVFYILAWMNMIESTEEGLIILGYLVFCLALIWNGDWLGSITGVRFGNLFSPYVNKPTPGYMVSFIGWCLLILPLCLMIWVLLTTPANAVCN